MGKTEDPERLNTWKEIADYLGVSVRSAQNFEENSGLPVHRLTGVKARVYALRFELDAWKLRAAATTRQPDQQSQADSSPPAPGSIPLTHNRSPSVQAHKRRLTPYVLIVAALVVLVASTVLWSVVQPGGNPTSYSVNGKLLTVLDQRNRKLWSYELPGEPPRSPPPARPTDPREVFVDLDDDGINEVVYVDYDWARGPEIGPTAHTLLCFGSNGELWWSHSPGRDITTVAGQSFTGPFQITLLGALKHPTPDGGRLVVGSRHPYVWAYQVVLLSAEGNTLSEYWHPGWFTTMDIADLDGDGFDEVLLGGVNNSYKELVEDGREYGPTLVILDSRRMSGHGAVTGKDDRQIQGVPTADEKAVLLFQAPEHSPDRGRFFWAKSVALRNDSVMVQVRNTAEHVAYYPYAIFLLNRNLRLINIQPEPNFQAKLLRGLSPSATTGERLNFINGRLGSIKYLKNQFVDQRQP